MTRVVPRIEKIFREEREVKILQIKKDIDESERAGGGGAAGRFGPGRGNMRNPADVNF